MIAKRTYDEAFSDARIAVLTLYNLAQICETKGLNKLSSEYVDEAFKQAVKLAKYEHISRINDKAFLVLYSIGLANKNGITSSSEIYKKFFTQVYSRVYGNVLSERQFRRYVSYLNSFNLVNIYKKRKGAVTAFELECNVDWKLLEEEYGKRFEEK